MQLAVCLLLADACLLSPAHVPQCIAVAASDVADSRWADSNYGSCVDLYAPGVDITSAMFTSASATIVASGTSMACPMVSGVAAQYLQVSAPRTLITRLNFALTQDPNETSVGSLGTCGPNRGYVMDADVRCCDSCSTSDCGLQLLKPGASRAEEPGCAACGGAGVHQGQRGAQPDHRRAHQRWRPQPAAAGLVRKANAPSPFLSC